MITNVLNESNYYFETWNTLRFAAKAKSIKVSPKANFDTEGSEEALKQEINHLLRKIDMLEKKGGSQLNTTPVNNQDVIKLVDRLEVAWDGLINGIEERQLLLKEAILSSDEFFINLIMEFREALAGRGSEILLRTKFLPILEEMEEFFGQNWNGIGPREVIDKLHCFHEIVKDEIKALKGVVQSKPQTAKDKLKRIKKRWKHSLERIDEIVSDEEEEKEIINGLLSCMDENEPFEENDELRQSDQKYIINPSVDHIVERLDDERDSIRKIDYNQSNDDFSNQLKIDLTRVSERVSTPTSAYNDNQDVSTNRNTSKTGRLSSSRTKDPKLAEVQELLKEFTPQKIRMILKENNLLNKKIQKQRFLILEMRNKMDEVEDNRRDKTYRLNKSCDEIPTSVLGNLEKVVDDSMAQWNDMDTKHLESVFDERRSTVNRRTTHRSRMPSMIPHIQAGDEQVVIDDDFKINSPRNIGVGESLREIDCSKNFGDRDEMFQPTPQKYSSRIDQNQKNVLVNNLFDPRQRFHPKSSEAWRDTILERETTGQLAGIDSINPMLSTALDGLHINRRIKDYSYGSPEKDPFNQTKSPPHQMKFKDDNDELSPAKPSPEKYRLKRELESLSKKFKELEDQKKVWENKALTLEAQKENKLNFSKNKSGSISETPAPGKLNGEVLSPMGAKITSKGTPQPAKIALFSNTKPSKPAKSLMTPATESQTTDDRSEMQERTELKSNTNTPFSFSKHKKFDNEASGGYISPTLYKNNSGKFDICTDEALRMADDRPPRILTEFMPEDSMRRSNNDDEIIVLDSLLQEKTKEAMVYLKQIEKLQKENDHLRENTEGSSSLSLYKLKIENRKLKDAIKKIAGKVKQEIGETDLL